MSAGGSGYARLRGSLAQVSIPFTVTFLVAVNGIFMLGPYLHGAASTLRADDFWSYSGGFARRGLFGEALIVLGRVLGRNPTPLMSLLLLALFAVATVYVLRLLWRDAPLMDRFLLIGTPLLYGFGVDREVVLLAPALMLYLGRRRGSARWTHAGLAAIPLVCLVHELAIALYAPYLLVVYASRPGPERTAAWTALAASAALLVGLVLMGSDPNLRPETEFWPAFGVVGLESTELYRFATVGLGEILSERAATYLSWDGLTTLMFSGLLAEYLVLGIGRSTAVRLATFATIAGTFVLTSDHGRYAYVLLYLFVLLRAAHLDAPDEGSVWTGPRVRPFLVGFWMSPVGLWAGDIGWPTILRIYHDLSRITGLSL